MINYKLNIILIQIHSLCDEKNIFDSVLIITDRIVVDQQLQNAIISIDHKQGLIKVDSSINGQYRYNKESIYALLSGKH